MTAAVAELPEVAHSDNSYRADPLALGVAMMLGLTIAQKIFGFLRNILFCGLLEDFELGRWSLCYSFLLLAAPLAVAGLPGSFGRYVEHYRQRNQLKAFLTKASLVSGTLALLSVLLLFIFPKTFAALVLGDATQTGLVYLLGAALLFVIVFNYLIELLVALRQARLVSVVQLINGLVFAGVGAGLLLGTELRDGAVVLAFGISAAVGVLTAAIALWWIRSAFSGEQQQLPGRDLWSKLAPFAAWVWATNLITNLFGAADRFMIVHFAGEAKLAEALVGQYHASLAIPVMLTAVACMLAGMFLPYLSHDWETGKRDAVSRQVNLSLKLTSFGFTAGSVAILACSPLLFGWLLSGRYDEGLHVMPLTLVYCIWFSLTMLAQGYLWAAEKAKFGSLALLIGLIANIGLNLLLLPIWGLTGAVAATTISNALALALVYWFNLRAGMKCDFGAILLAILPITLLLGPLACSAALLAAAWLAVRGNWLLSAEEKSLLRSAVGGRLERFVPFRKLTA